MKSQIQDWNDEEYDKSWKIHAACRALGPETFFTLDSTRHDLKDCENAAAAKLCGICTVRQPCLDYQVRFESVVHYRSGIFGGTTPRQRDRMFGNFNERKNQWKRDHKARLRAQDQPIEEER